MTRRNSVARAGSVSSKGVVVSWINHHGRSADLAEALDAEPIFIYPRIRSTVVRYLASSIMTLYMFISDRPRFIVFMQPPFPLAIVSYLYSRLRGVPVAVDVHSGAVNDPRWRWSFPLLSRLFKKSCFIVTNLDLLNGQPIHEETKIIVLHDILPLGTPPAPADDKHSHIPKIVFPASYANDEPIDEIIEAARMRPEWCWILTGNAPAEVRQLAPSNLQFTGYVDQSEYLEVIRSADVVLALTRREETMQRGGYEALANFRPIVASATGVLKSFFSDAALYTENSPSGISAAVGEALSRSRSLSSAGWRVLEENTRRQDVALRDLERWLGGKLTSNDVCG